MPKWLKDARSEIIGGLVVALIVGLCSMLPFGAAKNEAEHSQEDSQRVTELRSQVETLQQELQREKARKKRPAMSDSDFIALCKSGNAKKLKKP